MKNLLAFLRDHFHWFLFVVLEALSGVLLFQYNSYQSSVWFSSASVLTGWVYEGSAAVEAFFSLRKVNQDLTLRNYYLERQLAQLRRLYNDSTQAAEAKDTDDWRILQQYQLIPAKVITNELHHANNLMTIDKGAADGVEAGMGVACGQGVVGVVHLTSAH